MRSVVRKAARMLRKRTRKFEHWMRPRKPQLGDEQVRPYIPGAIMHLMASIMTGDQSFFPGPLGFCPHSGMTSPAATQSARLLRMACRICHLLA